mgnify:CR=1 FL=1
MVLSVRELKDINQIKSNKRKEIYKELLNHIYAKIHEKNKNGFKSLIYLLCPIALGKPLINIDHASSYIYKKLIRGNFKVNIIYNKIYVDWS